MTKQEKFQKAVEKNDIETVKELLKDNEVNPADNDNLAIRYASSNGHIEIVKLLLDDDSVDPADRHNLAIKWASKNGHDEIVKMLYYDYRICHLQLVLVIIEKYGINKPIKLIKRLIEDTDLQIFHPENESLDKKISSLDLIKALYNADENTKQTFIKCGFDQNLFAFISLLK